MPASAFEYFLGHENQRRVKLLEENHNVSAFVLALLDHLVAVANHKGIPFREIALDDPHVSPGGEYIQARIR